RYMGYAINPCAIFDFANQTTHTDTFTFDKNTYQNARNYSPAANSEYAKAYLAKNPTKPYVRKSSASGRASGSSSYQVRKGDSLSKIASRNGTTVKKLCALNGLTTSSKLRIGQRLRLR
ncbi:MAG: LysM peptidoglycan-binding domain-containing protein, partial [Muribaculaceae bacterium]|nr:LysM peptidoglycan-binding domain-containing protein [Muribaculaceae bacterium]